MIILFRLSVVRQQSWLTGMDDDSSEAIEYDGRHYIGNLLDDDGGLPSKSGSHLTGTTLFVTS